MRKLLAFFEITKTEELVRKAQLLGMAEFHSDEEKVRAKVAKRGVTVAERYGNNWYRNIASKGELELVSAV